MNMEGQMWCIPWDFVNSQRLWELLICAIIQIVAGSYSGWGVSLPGATTSYLMLMLAICASNLRLEEFHDKLSWNPLPEVFPRSLVVKPGGYESIPLSAINPTTVPVEDGDFYRFASRKRSEGILQVFDFWRDYHLSSFRSPAWLSLRSYEDYQLPHYSL